MAAVVAGVTVDGGGLVCNCGETVTGFLGIIFCTALFAKGLLSGDVSFSESTADLLLIFNLTGGLRFATCGFVWVNGSKIQRGH